LNDNVKARIAPATQARVRRAAIELGYRPNVFARSLLGKAAHTLGLMMPTFENPFFADVARTAWRTAADKNYHLLLDAQLQVSNHFRDVPTLAPWPVDGLLIWADSIQDVASLIGRDARDLPVVYLGLTCDDDVDAVTFDFYAGMRVLMDSIVAKGYRNPALIAPAGPEGDLTDPASRHRSYRDYCNETGLSAAVIRLAPNAMPLVSAFQVGYSLSQMTSSARPDVAVCFNDQIAIGVYNGVRRAGLRVPQDIAVAGFDGIIEGQYIDQSLTTATIPIEQACKLAIELLIHRIDGGTTGAKTRITLPIPLLSGATT
jgi:DNA-binding LacI/PurR family transcriptional regulator